VTISRKTLGAESRNTLLLMARTAQNSSSFLGARSSVAENRRVAWQLLKAHPEDLFRVGDTREHEPAQA
jgi:hypothetical protein